MKMKNQSVVNTWESEVQEQTAKTGFESGLRRFSRTCLHKLNQLKEALTQEMAFQFAGTLGPELIRKVVNEADAIAASTPFPALFLPALAEEKVQQAWRWQAKQRLIESRSWMHAA